MRVPSPFAANTVAYNADNLQTLWNGLNQVFDPDGNLTCTGSSSGSSCTGSQSHALGWDARNRLTQAAGSPALAGSAESYVYDGHSRRQSVTMATAATRATYLYRGVDPVSVSTVNTVSGATVDLTKIFVGLGLDERFQVNGSSASNTGTIITDSQNHTKIEPTSPSTTAPPTHPSAAQVRHLRHPSTHSDTPDEKHPITQDYTTNAHDTTHQDKADSHRKTHSDWSLDQTFTHTWGTIR